MNQTLRRTTAPPTACTIVVPDVGMLERQVETLSGVESVLFAEVMVTLAADARVDLAAHYVVGMQIQQQDDLTAPRQIGPLQRRVLVGTAEEDNAVAEIMAELSGRLAEAVKEFGYQGGGAPEDVGPNPVVRGKPGSKHHLLADRDGAPLATWLTAANVHDSEVFEGLIEAVEPIRRPGGPGRPRCRPAKLHADKA